MPSSRTKCSTSGISLPAKGMLRALARTDYRTLSAEILWLVNEELLRRRHRQRQQVPDSADAFPCSQDTLVVPVGKPVE